MPEQATFLTPNGLEKVKRDLEHLRTVRRPQVIRQLQEALEQASAQATPLENPDYEAAKNEQAFIEGRILQLEQILHTAVLIEAPGSTEVASLGSRVVIAEVPDGPPEHYTIVGSVEADPARGYISNESPLGRALMGCQQGDQITVAAPDGDIVFQVQNVG
jgi:transcription elongation factor GreA